WRRVGPPSARLQRKRSCVHLGQIGFERAPDAGPCRTTEPAADVVPQPGDLFSAARLALDLTNGPAVDHARGKTRALVKDHGCKSSMLRKRHNRFVGDTSPGSRAVDHEYQRLAYTLYRLHRSTNGAQIMRARSHRDDDQVAKLDDISDSRLDRGRR